ncbi:hypothetical protein [Algoriphagus sp.]|uniref:hypothetical protein n=1 Tax=Algoriphagus sp. TaxID=1872435 RepID=UPI00391D8F53
MRHILWFIVHYAFFLAIPNFGASISLFLFLLIEIVTVFLKKNRFSLIHFYFLGLLISVLANIQLIYDFNFGDGVAAYPYAIPEFFPIAALVFAIGNQAICIGYQSIMTWKIPKVDFSVKLSEKNLKRVFYIGLIFSFKNYWIFFELPGSFQTIIEVIPIICIFILGKYAGKFNIKTLYNLAIILTVSVGFNAFLFSYLRMEIILPILVFLLSYFIGSNSLKSFFSLKFVPVIVLIVTFLSFFSLFGDQRSQLSVGFDRISQFFVGASNEALFDIDQEEKLSPFERSSNIAQVSSIIGLTYDNGYYNGLASAPLAAALVPRVFWPEKPVIALGVWFALEIDAASETEDWYNNSINMTIPGNLFLDFGWPGLIIGCFFIGVFIKLLWDSTNFYGSKFNILGTFLGVYLLFTGFLGIGADLQILITYLAIYIVLLILSLILKRSNENTVYRSNVERK